MLEEEVKGEGKGGRGAKGGGRRKVGGAGGGGGKERGQLSVALAINNGSVKKNWKCAIERSASIPHI